MHILDNPAAMAPLDAAQMLGYLHDLPEVGAAAFERGAQALLPLLDPKTLLVCGMGGSAISGDLLRTQLMSQARFPVLVHRGDELPAFAGADTLLVIMSYSGHTGETLGCMRAALARGVPMVVVSCGGEAGRLATEHGIPVVPLTPGWQPRAAMGELFFALLGIASQLEPAIADPAPAIRALRRQRDRLAPEVPLELNPAKRLALSLFGKTPLIVGQCRTTEAVANRWKCQLNENSKQTTLMAILPEMTHNDIVNLGASAHEGLALVAISDPEDSAFTSQQRRLMLELIGSGLSSIFELEGEGDSLMARQLTACHFGDYVSVYLAFLKGVDPTPVASIVELKGRMAEVTRA